MGEDSDTDLTQAARVACLIILSWTQNTLSLFLSRSHLILEVTPSIPRKAFHNSQNIALVEPLSVAWHAVTRSPLQEDDTVLIVGAGPIGLAIVQVLQARQIKTIIVVEISEQRRRFAQSFGATHTLNPKDGDAVAEIRAITGDVRGVSVAFECSGVQAGLDTALGGTRVRGTTVIVSLWEEKPSIDVFVNAVLGEKYITGAAMYDDEDFHAVIEAIASGESLHSITILIFLGRPVSDAFLF
jgi:threonine dehydrogenase-like Zn-dependent dehydrogenase